MKIAIRAIEAHNENILRLLQDSGVELVCFADADCNKWNTDSPSIIPPGEAYAMYKRGEIDSFFISSYLPKIRVVLEEMLLAGIRKEDICIISVQRLNQGSNITVEEIQSGCFNPDNWHQIYYLEFHIADNCNLNCSGCIHFSSLVSNHKSVPIEQVECDLRRLRKIVDHIEWVRILGGEPFLNNEWQSYVKLVKQLYPYTKLEIATNGLLLRNLKDSDYNFLRENQVCLAITTYPPLFGKEQELANMLYLQNINFGFSAPVVYFRSCLQKNPTLDAKHNRDSCGAYCFNIHYGKMAPCPIMMYIKDFNSYFGFSYPEEQPVDLSEDMDFKMLMAKLNKPMPLCAYCNQTKVTEWSRLALNKKVASDDWLADV